MLEGGAWVVFIDEGAGEMRLTFKGGKTFEAGTPVGSYERAGRSLIATVGQDVRLIVDLSSESVGEIQARLLTSYDGKLMDEPARLLRADYN